MARRWEEYVPHKKTCVTCGTRFVGHGNRRYCDNVRCAPAFTKSALTPSDGFCRSCGDELERNVDEAPVTFSRRRHCSVGCWRGLMDRRRLARLLDERLGPVA